MSVIFHIPLGFWIFSRDEATLYEGVSVRRTTAIQPTYFYDIWLS